MYLHRVAVSALRCWRYYYLRHVNGADLRRGGSLIAYSRDVRMLEILVGGRAPTRGSYRRAADGHIACGLFSPVLLFWRAVLWTWWTGQSRSTFFLLLGCWSWRREGQDGNQWHLTAGADRALSTADRCGRYSSPTSRLLSLYPP